MDNTSGQGEAARVPTELEGWNWGAFLLNWIWGLGNNTLIALLMFVPFVNLVMGFVLGAKGNAWAWRNKRWDSVEQFLSVQRRWARWGVVVWIGGAVLGTSVFLGIFSMLKNSEAYQLAVSELKASPQVLEWIGQPLSTGIPMGSIRVSGSRGEAQLSFSVQGPKGEGTAQVEAIRDLGRWEIRRMTIEKAGTGERLLLVD